MSATPAASTRSRLDFTGTLPPVRTEPPKRGFFVGLCLGAFVGTLAAVGAGVILGFAISVLHAAESRELADSVISGAALAYLIALFGLPIGMVSGGLAGGLLAATGSAASAPGAGLAIASIVGLLLGQILLSGRADEPLAALAFTLCLMVAVLVGATGWLVGRLFKTIMHEPM